MKIRVTKPGVTDGNSTLDVGAETELDAKNAVSLIAGGYAEAVEDADGGELTAEEMAKALDKKYKAEEIKAAAEKAGVQFGPTATKAVVIAAIIEAGKYANLT
jgi:hypothetical protein